VAELAESFQAALFIYDEGLTGSDRQLANAVWRRFYNRSDAVVEHPERLEMVVAYIRRTVAALDAVEFAKLIFKGVRWLPLVGHENKAQKATS